MVVDGDDDDDDDGTISMHESALFHSHAFNSILSVRELFLVFFPSLTTRPFSWLPSFPLYGGGINHDINHSPL